MTATEVLTTDTTATDTTAAADTATTTTAADVGAEQAAQAAAAGKWHDSFTDADLKGYIDNKAFESPEALANSYRNLEKLVGKPQLPMPKDGNDNEALNKIYTALGRPEKADDYKVPVPDGFDDKFAKQAAPWFHEAGLSQKQVEVIVGKYNEAVMAGEAESAKAVQAQSDAELSALKGEWGQAYDQKVQAGKEAVQFLGLDADALNGLEAAMGTKGMMTMLAKIGEGMAEAPSIGFDAGKGSSGRAYTPQAARDRIGELQKDQAWVTKYLQGDAGARKEMEDLHKAASAGR